MTIGRYKVNKWESAAAIVCTLLLVSGIAIAESKTKEQAAAAKTAKEEARKVSEQIAATKKIETDLKDAVLRAAKDPDSAKFGEIKMVSSICACVEVNARNSYGGYGGMKVVMLKMLDAKWEPFRQTDNTEECVRRFGFTEGMC